MTDAPAIHARLMARQRAWAESRELEVDGEGRLASWDENLLVPASTRTRAELSAAASVHLVSNDKPGRLHDLGSGLALAANVFEPWRESPGDLAAHAPELGRNPRRIAFATKLPLLAGDASGDALAADVDVLLEGGDSPATAVVPLFVEPFTDVDPRVRDVFARDAAQFQQLPGCALLARDLHANPSRFRRLAAGRVLETALAMSHRFGRRGFRITVLWYDAGGRASRRIQAELDRLRMRIGGEVALVATSWQTLCARLDEAPTRDHRYSRTLYTRYFGTSPLDR